MNPEMNLVHREEADGPTECITVMAQDWKSLMWETLANVPSYGEWLFTADHHSAYEHHKLALQILQSEGVRGHWALKSPHHAIALDELSDVYPDATFVMLHRDPVVVAASSCSLIRVLTQKFTDVDHARLHRPALGGRARGMHRPARRFPGPASGAPVCRCALRAAGDRPDGRDARRSMQGPVSSSRPRPLQQ